VLGLSLLLAGTPAKTAQVIHMVLSAAGMHSSNKITYGKFAVCEVRLECLVVTH
jgi:hypothetical protein